MELWPLNSFLILRYIWQFIEALSETLADFISGGIRDFSWNNYGESEQYVHFLMKETEGQGSNLKGLCWAAAVLQYCIIASQGLVTGCTTGSRIPSQFSPGSTCTLPWEAHSPHGSFLKATTKLFPISFKENWTLSILLSFQILISLYLFFFLQSGCTTTVSGLKSMWRSTCFINSRTL
jgi:hypothetical protein